MIPSTHDHLECLMHDKLSGAGRQSGVRQLRHHAGPDDNGSLIHERSGHSRRPSQRLATGPRRRDSTSFQHRPARRKRFPWLSRSLRASSTGSHFAYLHRLYPSSISSAETERPTTIDDMNKAFNRRFEERRDRQGFLAIPMNRWCRRISRQDPRSSIVDGLSTMVIGGNDGKGRRLVRQRVGIFMSGR